MHCSKKISIHLPFLSVLPPNGHPVFIYFAFNKRLIAKSHLKL